MIVLSVEEGCNVKIAKKKRTGHTTLRPAFWENGVTARCRLTNFENQGGPAIAGGTAGPQKVPAALDDRLFDAFDDQPGGG